TGVPADADMPADQLLIVTSERALEEFHHVGRALENTAWLWLETEHDLLVETRKLFGDMKQILRRQLEIGLPADRQRRDRRLVDAADLAQQFRQLDRVFDAARIAPVGLVDRIFHALAVKITVGKSVEREDLEFP